MTNKVKLRIIYILMFFYAIYDVLNSASAGNATDDRSRVYVFLFAVVVCLFIFCVCKRFLPNISIVMLPILIAIYYVVDVCLIKGQTSWSVIVYFGLSAWWVLIIWFFYTTVSENIEAVYSIQNFVRIMFILYSIAITYGAVNIAANYSVDYARVGYIYHLLAMLPIVLLDCNEKIKNIFLVIAIGLTIFSFKRGAILILPLMLMAYYLFNNNVSNKGKNILKLIGIMVALAVAWYVINRYSGGYLSSRFTRAELSDGSGRSDIWNAALENVSQRNFVQLLFGIGGAGERKLWTGIHNEWISFLYNNGIVGLMLFFAFILTIIRQAFVMIKCRSKLAGAYAALVAFVLGVCMVSGFYHVHSTFYVMLFLGYTQGLLLYDNETIDNTVESERK